MIKASSKCTASEVWKRYNYNHLYNKRSGLKFVETDADRLKIKEALNILNRVEKNDIVLLTKDSFLSTLTTATRHKLSTTENKFLLLDLESIKQELEAGRIEV